MKWIVEGVVLNTEIDRYGESFTLECLKNVVKDGLGTYKIIEDFDVNKPVGRVLKIWLEKNSIYIRGRIIKKFQFENFAFGIGGVSLKTVREKSGLRRIEKCRLDLISLIPKAGTVLKGRTLEIKEVIA